MKLTSSYESEQKGTSQVMPVGHASRQAKVSSEHAERAVDIKILPTHMRKSVDTIFDI